MAIIIPAGACACRAEIHPGIKPGPGVIIKHNTNREAGHDKSLLVRHRYLLRAADKIKFLEDELGAVTIWVVPESAIKLKGMSPHQKTGLHQRHACGSHIVLLFHQMDPATVRTHPGGSIGDAPFIFGKTGWADHETADTVPTKRLLPPAAVTDKGLVPPSFPATLAGRHTYLFFCLRLAIFFFFCFLKSNWALARRWAAFLISRLWVQRAFSPAAGSCLR